MSSSSSSQTATASRSPSPTTPSTPDSSDNIQLTPFRTTIDLSTWYKTLSAEPTSPSAVYWDENPPRFFNPAKEDGANILSLDDLIQDSAYDDSSSPGLSTTAVPTVPSKVIRTPISNTPSTSPSHPFMDCDLSPAVTMVPPQVPISPTKPVPPPASQPRKKNPSASQTVVYPPKESCSNLAIMVPSIPEGGTKSRVETQVRVTVDLAYASATAGEQPSQYDRVGSWKWLRLPKGTATKKRTRKEGKIDPLIEDTLQLTVEITCASPPHSRVVCCSSCQGREAKRVARKLAQRVRPQRYDSDSPEAANAAANGTTEPFNIVQFNCPEVLSFSSGTVVFPLRITCYCRHHRERVGFHVHFTMSDHTGRIVGTGTTHPIMITDDHKSTGANTKQPPPAEADWLQLSGDAAPEKATSSKRKHSHTPEITSDQGKKRLKMNGTSYGDSKGFSRRSSSGSLDSPSAFTSALPTRATTPQPASSGSPSQFSSTAPPSPRISPRFIVPGAEVPLPSPRPSVASPGGPEPAILDTSEVLLSAQPLLDMTPLAVAERGVSPATFLPTAPPSPVAISVPQYQLLQDPLASAPLPFMFFPEPPPMTPISQPRIHRLIPSSGPIIGGIEVTVLGSNFHPSFQLNCIFGDVMASSTQRWSDNTLVCILPPRATSGVVAVWLGGFQKEEDGTPPCLFTYTDESDRALMELALQVVGLKMTGKLEDAKSVAMRIVGPPNEDTQSGSSVPNAMQLATDSISLGLRSALHHMGPWSGLEKMVVDLLSLLDIRMDTPSRVSLAKAMDLKTGGGQTLLHFAAFLNYPTLVSFLIEHQADKDARDHNGYTALHFASLVGAQGCAAILLDAGADVEIVNVEGKTAQELAAFNFSDLQVEDSVADGESRWGDGEDSEDEMVHNPVLSRHPSRVFRRGIEVAPLSSSEDDSHHIPEKLGKENEDNGVDEKRAATFMRTIQRTLARVQPKDGIIPNMPHLALPQLLQLPGMPGVPWGALPQIPTVFPVYVPWPASLRTSRGSDTDTDTGGPVPPKGKMRSLLTPQEWLALLEKYWLAQGPQAAMEMHDGELPPVYTPRAEDESEQPVAGSSMSLPERPVTRQVGYDTGPVPDDREVNAYEYLPRKKQARQIQNKEDRMLLLFWIPILLRDCPLWAFTHVVRIAVHSVRTIGPLRAVLRL
ncbi:hypothetical protein B0F90DRAFT_1700490 [Multifurca ochricompacta]|uniref:IPT/TIG domain-containing protein n=1 Tax=Multifurca ochricompacta TaxID=376703 RepID=A0AAD4QPK5_9AGAM|nr:hypothetical protein B0F90DRAFT_1700490 [Multifurca ochricompacta]